MNASRFLAGALLVLAIALGAVWWLQRQAAAELRVEMALLRDEQREAENLRAENARLAAALPPPEELARLRADHAAVGRLRGEIGTLRDSVQKREQALRADPGTGAK